MSEPSESYHSPWPTPPDFMRKKISPQKPEKGHSFLITVLLVLLIAGGTLYFFYFRKPQGPNVSLEFTRPSQIAVGDPFVLPVSFSNYSDAVLKNAKLSLFLPDGISFLGQSPAQRVSEQAVGDLGPGSVNQQSFNLIVTSGGDTLKRIKAKLVYATAQNSNVQFESLGEADLLVGQPAISLNFQAPQSVFNGQDFEVKVSYGNNTGHDFKNVHLRIDYPPFFQFKRSTMQTEGGGNNSWDLGTLPAGSNGTISITGSVVGPEKSFFTLNGFLTSDFLGITYTLNVQTVSIAISPAPLSVEANLNGSSGYVANLGDTLSYALNYKNNSDVIMQNITISAKLIGELFDFQTLQANAAFNSLSNTISWFAANTPQLANLGPGQSGSVNFTIKLKNSFPIRLLSDKNYTLKLHARIESPTVPPQTTAEKTLSLTSLENKVAGRLTVAAEAYWRDAPSGILNTGPYPPKVNQPTRYTIHWRIVNYATDVANVKVSAYLQSGSRFTGKVKSNIDSAPTYDANSGLVTWQIGPVPAAKGVVSPPIEAIFQMENTPALNQIGQNVPLLSETKIEGGDSFIGSTLQASAPAQDTSLPYDKTITTTERMVKQ